MSSQLRKLWIIVMSAIYTAITCGQSILKQLLGHSTRSWVDRKLQVWSTHLLRLVKAKYRVFNPYHIKPIPGVPTIIMSNHSSAYDIPLSFKVFPHHSIRMLAKKELFKIPIFGKGMAAAEFPFIDRKNKTQAIQDLAYVRRLMESGIVIWVAPEGTRSRNGVVGAFKKGAFITAINAQATIIPLGICGAHQILPAHSLSFRLNQPVELHVGKPIDASQFSLDNKEELIQLVHHSIKSLVSGKEIK